jgi:hypothetical protein
MYQEDDNFNIIQHLNENKFGVFLLFLAFGIIYIVEYISRMNALIFSMPSPIPGVQSSVSTIIVGKPKKNKK